MKKSISIFLFGVLLLSFFMTGCSNSTSDNTFLGEVTSVSDQTIILAIGTEKEMESNMSDQEPPSGEPPSGTAGEAPTGEPPTDGTVGERPSMLDLTGEVQEISIDDETVITIESNDQTTEGSISDIKEGDVLSITCDNDNKTARTIIVKSFGMNGGEGETPSGDMALGDSQTGNISLTGAYTVDSTEETSSGETISATTENENAVLVTNGGSLTLSDATISKSGDTTSEDESNFYALNSVIAATLGSTINVRDTTISSDSDGSNAIFATGDDSVINVFNVTIHTTNNSSRGLDATYNGTIIAKDVDITTKGAHSAALATDRGEGMITVTSGTLSTAGDGSPCIYSTGEITATDVTGVATGSQAAVIEGKNSITLLNSDLTGAGENGIMLYQSTSGDAGVGTSVLNSTDSKLSTTSSGEMFYVTNTDAEVNLTNTTLSFSSGILINAAGNETNNWGTPGSNGGNLTFNATNQTLSGDILCDEISTVSFSLKEGSTYEGTIDAENTGVVAIKLSKDSIWNVTGDSYISSLTNDDTDLENITSNGFTIYYDATNEDNDWLNGKTITLQDGGKLTPVE